MSRTRKWNMKREWVFDTTRRQVLPQNLLPANYLREKYNKFFPLFVTYLSAPFLHTGPWKESLLPQQGHNTPSPLAWTQFPLCEGAGQSGGPKGDHLGIPLYRLQVALGPSEVMESRCLCVFYKFTCVLRFKRF